MEAHAVPGNAYEVVRKPTTAGLYRINLVSSRDCETLLPPSLSLSRPLSFDESLTDYVVPRTPGASDNGVRRREDTRASGKIERSVRPSSDRVASVSTSRALWRVLMRPAEKSDLLLVRKLALSFKP